MLTAVILLGTLGALLAGFVAVRRFGAFLDAGGCSPVPERPQDVRVLLLAPEELRTPLLLRLDARGLSVSAPVRYELPEGLRFSVVLALTDSDLLNLQLCAAARRRCPSCAAVARWREAIYQPLYHTVGADRLLPPDCTPEEALAAMKGLLADDPH